MNPIFPSKVNTLANPSEKDHAALYFEYRQLFLKTPQINDGRLQPYINLSLGVTVPHLETRFNVNGHPQKTAYSYQAGWKNLGFASGLGLRFRPFKGIGFNLEYKLTYSILNDMYFDNDTDSNLKMDFFAGQLMWGLSFIF